MNVSVTDGTYSNSFNYTIFSKDESSLQFSPVINDIADLDFIVNEFVDIELNATDIDTPNNDFKWSICTNADWLSLYLNHLTGTPDKNGTYWLEVTVSDGINFDKRNFTIIVKDRPIVKNKPPELSIVDLPKAFVNKTFRATLSAYDADGDQLEWKIVTDAVFLALNGTVLSGVPGNSDIGNHFVTVTVSDGKDNDSITFTVKVMDELKGEDIYDILLNKNSTSGVVVVSISELFGKEYVDIVEVEWYVDGHYYGNETLLELELSEGTHTIKLRFKDSDGQWYEVVKTIDVEGVNDPDEPLLLYLAILTISLIALAILSITVLSIRRRHWAIREIRAGDGAHAEMDMDWEDQGIGSSSQSIGLSSGRLSQWKGPRDISGNDHGPLTISRSSDGDYVSGVFDRIRSEALSEMKSSRSSLKRSGMRKKLREKYTSGEIDRELYEELRSFIDDNVGE